MTQMKTAELQGAALDWAAAKALGYLDGTDARGEPCWMDGERLIESKHKFRPSADWSYGGPLIKAHSIGFKLIEDDWLAIYDERAGYGKGEFGPTHLIAACRAIVTARLGETVEIPADLLIQNSRFSNISATTPPQPSKYGH